MEIKVPQLAEGVSSGTIVNIFVKVGDKVSKDQDILEIETEKAVAAIPSPAEGVVAKVHVKEGDSVQIGQPLISLQEQSISQAEPKGERLEPEKVTSDREETVIVPPPVEEKKAVSEDPALTRSVPPVAPPSIRRLARQIGLDLGRVRGTEAGGRIGWNDIKAYIQWLQQKAFPLPEQTGKTSPVQTPTAVDFSRWGPVRREKMNSLRKKISEAMVESWRSIPHVTQFDEADLTAILQVREQYASIYEDYGTRLTITPILIKALLSTLKKHPLLNASIDEVNEEIVYKDYIHLGIAVDTEQGLIVPVLRDADKKSVLELARELQEIAEKTRQRKVSIEELRGASFTISNQGGIGGQHFTPIIPRSQVAILGIGRGVKKPVVREGKSEIRTMVPLALSYDHRLIDGGKAARFIKDLVAAIEHFDVKELEIQKKEKNEKGKITRRQKSRTSSKKSLSPRQRKKSKTKKVPI